MEEHIFEKCILCLISVRFKRFNLNFVVDGAKEFKDISIYVECYHCHQYFSSVFVSEDPSNILAKYIKTVLNWLTFIQIPPVDQAAYVYLTNLIVLVTARNEVRARLYFHRRV